MLSLSWGCRCPSICHKLLSLVVRARARAPYWRTLSAGRNSVTPPFRELELCMPRFLGTSYPEVRVLLPGDLSSCSSSILPPVSSRKILEIAAGFIVMFVLSKNMASSCTPKGRSSATLMRSAGKSKPIPNASPEATKASPTCPST